MFFKIVTIYYINPSLSLSEYLSPTTRSKKKRKYKRNEMKNTYLYYTKTWKKNQKLLLKMKTARALVKYRGLYRHRNILDDETGPRVENRRVAPPNQGDISLVLVRGSVLTLEASWYILCRVISSEYSSDVCKSLDSTYLLNDPLLGLQVMRI